MQSLKYSLTQNIFAAEIKNVKSFYTIVKAINFKEVKYISYRSVF